MSKSLVSIITPFFNAEKTIAETINSVLNQRCENFELLLINDGSTDNSLQEITKINDARIRVFSQENAGVAAARNLGLAHACGDFICFLDADDLMTSDALTSRLEVFQNNPSLGIVAGGQVQKNYDLSETLFVQTPNFRGHPQKELVKLNPKCFINCGTWLIKKEVIGDKRFPLGWTHSEDLAFFFLISENAKLDFVTNNVQIYRRHPNSAMANLDGLEDGYIRFIRLVREKNFALLPRLILKLKASKIMLLSFRAQNKISRAIKSFFRILFA